MLICRVPNSFCWTCFWIGVPIQPPIFRPSELHSTWSATSTECSSMFRSESIMTKQGINLSTLMILRLAYHVKKSDDILLHPLLVLSLSKYNRTIGIYFLFIWQAQCKISHCICRHDDDPLKLYKNFFQMMSNMALPVSPFSSSPATFAVTSPICIRSPSTASLSLSSAIPTLAPANQTHIPAKVEIL